MEETKNDCPYFMDPDTAKNASVADVFTQLQSGEEGLTQTQVDERLKLCGANALIEKHQNPIVQFLKYFYGPIPWMIEAAAILSLIASDYRDFVIIFVLLLFNGLIGFWEEHKAGNALAELKRSLALKARVRRDKEWKDIPAEDLVPGDVIRVRLGDVLPADCKLFGEGFLSTDQSALTGESLPVSKKSGDPAYSGTIVKQGEMTAVVSAIGGHTYLGRTAQLVAAAGNISHFQQAVMRIGNFLIIMALILCAVLVAVMIDRDAHSAHGLHVRDVLQIAKFVLILAVASIPVAMPAVLSVTMALGALAMSRKKAIVARLQSIEEMAGVDVLCSDKTGTLTQNKLTLDHPVLFAAKDERETILAAALASRAENNDVIDLAIINYLNDAAELARYTQTAFTPFDPVSKRTQATVTRDNKTLLFTKGAPQVISALCKPDAAVEKKILDTVAAFAKRGYRALGVARSENNGQTWAFLGVIPLFDPPREDSAETISRAKEHGLSVKMVTGDDLAIAAETCTKIGLQSNIIAANDLFGKENPEALSDTVCEEIEKADGFGRVFPEHKYGIVKALQRRHHFVAMTGDGVNDAPALKQADAGIAVSGATDAARAAAALILTAPGLSVIIDAIETARRTFERMLSYTIYRIAMTLDVMIFIVLAMLIFPTVMSLGAEVPFKPLTAVMIIILALLDDIPIMTIAYDHTIVDAKPVKWQMKKVIGLSVTLGLVSVVETFMLLLIGMAFLDETLFGVRVDANHLQTMMFLQLVVGGHLMLFVTRTRKWCIQRPFPSAPLFWAIILTQLFAACLCGFGWIVPALPWAFIGIVWLYNLCWMGVLDVVKKGVYHLQGNNSERTAAS